VTELWRAGDVGDAATAKLEQESQRLKSIVADRTPENVLAKTRLRLTVKGKRWWRK
jgi:hypothetical protein